MSESVEFSLLSMSNSGYLVASLVERKMVQHLAVYTSGHDFGKKTLLLTFPNVLFDELCTTSCHLVPSY